MGICNAPATKSERCGVLWDLDGTLIDSAEQHYAAWRDTLAERGREHSREEFARFFGRRNDVILGEMFGDDLPPGRPPRIADDKEERYRRLVRAGGLEPLPGVMDWLRRLKEQGFRQALATMAPAANVEVVVEVLGLGALLDATAAAEDVDARQAGPRHLPRGGAPDRRPPGSAASSWRTPPPASRARGARACGRWASSRTTTRGSRPTPSSPRWPPSPRTPSRKLLES